MMLKIIAFKQWIKQTIGRKSEKKLFLLSPTYFHCKYTYNEVNNTVIIL